MREPVLREVAADYGVDPDLLRYSLFYFAVVDFPNSRPAPDDQVFE